MRKFGIIVVLALLVMGCDDPAPIGNPREINFSSLYNRALIESVTDLQNEGIKVYGDYYLGNGVRTTVFDGERVYYDAELPGWTYDNTQFWISKAYYNFYAVSPNKYAADQYELPCTYSAESESVTITDYRCLSGGDDLLYAVASRDLTTEDDFSAVPLNFRHACAALKFNIINASNAAVTDVRNVRLVGLYNLGDFTFTINGTAAWTLKGNILPSNSTDLAGTCTLPNGGLPVNLNYKHPLYDYGSILVLPQNVYKTDVALHIEYKKEGENAYYNRDIMLGQLGGNTPTEWKSGQKYEYNLTVTTNTITTEVKVVDWVDHFVDL